MSGSARQAYRYALYLAPPEPWRTIGSRWLGRCADTGRTLAPAAGLDPRVERWTAAPRRYGLHATLKAPFRLAAGAMPHELDAAVRALARASRPFTAPLQRRQLRGFLAWCLADDEAAGQNMRQLADAAVARLDNFRAPPGAAELARRQARPLAPAEQAMLARWGYPYAFHTFTFHITLTGLLQADALRAADAQFALSGGERLPAGMPVESISVYVQPEPDADFVVARHYGFDGRVRDACGAAFLPAAAHG